MEGFVHQALIYRSDREFMDVALPFVEQGISTGEPILVAVQERNVENLRSALGGSPQGLSLFSVEQWYETSAKTRDKFERWVANHADAGRVRLIGEPPWAVGHEAQIRDWARHESVLNVAFAEYPLSFICTYDARVLPDEVIAHARSTHPEIVDVGGVSESGSYQDPFEFCSQLNAAVERPRGEPETKALFSVTDLPAIRRLVASTARSVGLTPSRADELVLAVNEIATNALVHGRPPATLRIWSGGEGLVCEVSDEGDGIRDVLAGQLTPAADAAGGRGLWITRMLCDAVEVRNGSGCTVSMHAVTPAFAAAG
jgi:anti-sigma regulatory factor (Ser/Thr protein kinase)